MHHIMYMNTATVQVTEEKLRQMLLQYRQYNQQHEITGLLLYSGDHYVQLIEGSEDILRKLFAKIQKDPLHRNIIKLADGQINHRLFSDWSMGFHHMSAEVLSRVKGYVNPFTSGFLDHLPERLGDSPVAVLRQFANHNLGGFRY